MLHAGVEQQDGEIDLRVLIHQSLAGCVIGKSGSKIKELREVSPGLKSHYFPKLRRREISSGRKEEVTVFMWLLFVFLESTTHCGQINYSLAFSKRAPPSGKY